MARQQATRNKQTTSIGEIPDKLYFRIGEVAKLCAVPAYVLRFWESEFPQLKPNKGGTGQRLYRRRDVEMALRVKTLLYDEGYTIAGARQAFKSEQKKDAPQLALGVDAAAAGVDLQKLHKLRGNMQDLLEMLSKSPAVKAYGASVQSIRSPRSRRTGTPPANASLFGENPPSEIPSNPTRIS